MTTSVVVVDDHAAVRLGLSVAIGSRPGLVCAGALPDAELVPALLYRARPDVVVLDYELPRVNGLELCRQIKGDTPAPAVVLYSAYVDGALTVPALLAGVDAMVHKAAPAVELFTAIEAAAQGDRQLPKPVPEVAEAAADAVDPALLVEPAERDLATALETVQIEPEADDLAVAAALAPHVNRFFDEVLVMAEDERVRANRLRLLLDVRDKLGRLGDFSLIPR
jgi:DNA-binding NarL/FixJ family response regulator